MRWAFPFIVAAITLGLSLFGAPPAPGYGTVPVRHEARPRLAAMPPACGVAQPAASALEAMRQAVAAASWKPALVWSGVVLGTAGSPLAAAWRGFVDHTKGRDGPLARRPCRGRAEG